LLTQLIGGRIDAAPQTIAGNIMRCCHRVRVKVKVAVSRNQSQHHAQCVKLSTPWYIAPVRSQADIISRHHTPRQKHIIVRKLYGASSHVIIVYAQTLQVLRLQHSGNFGCELQAQPLKLRANRCMPEAANYRRENFNLYFHRTLLGFI
jgi:hypothetical protein